MTAPCHPVPTPVAQEMLQLAAHALCDRPGDTVAQHESRIRQMVSSTLSMDPRDGFEIMLSTSLVGHYYIILDSIRDALVGQTDGVKARTKSTLVAIDRQMLAFAKEMQTARHRPAVNTASDVRNVAEAAAAPVDTAVSAAGAPDTAPADAAPDHASPDDAAMPIAAAAPLTTVPIEPPAAAEAPAPAASRPAPEQWSPAFAMALSLLPTAEAMEEGSIADHLAAFQAVLAAANETAPDTRAIEATERTASGG